MASKIAKSRPYYLLWLKKRLRKKRAACSLRKSTCRSGPLARTLASTISNCWTTLVRCSTMVTLPWLTRSLDRSPVGLCSPLASSQARLKVKAVSSVLMSVSMTTRHSRPRLRRGKAWTMRYIAPKRRTLLRLSLPLNATKIPCIRARRIQTLKSN